MLMRFLQTKHFMALRYRVWIYKYSSSLFEDEYFIIGETHVMVRDIVSLSNQLSQMNAFFSDKYDGLYFSICYLGDVFHMNDLPGKQDNDKQLKIPF